MGARRPQPRGRAGRGAHDKVAAMTTQRSTSWTLLALVASALATTACNKKNADTQPPEAKEAASDDSAADRGGDASEPEEPEFLTVNDFEDAMQGKNSDIGECFATAREAKPGLAGKLAYDFTIGGDGKVSDIKPDPASTIKDPGLDKCVREKANGWSFPKTRDGQPMTLPYAFNLS